MAKANVELKVRANNIDENRSVLVDLQSKKEKFQDARKQDELNLLFDRLNAECASRSLQEKKKAINVDKLEKALNPVHYGPVPGFYSGKWWGIRMDCSRDCIHEPFNENIHEGPFGAVSICTSHLNVHNDVDLGDFLTFTSGEYNPNDKSKDSLVLSFKNCVPLRVVRSYSLANDFPPKTGYRYDGLYTVVDHWIGLSSDGKKYHKFALARILDQEAAPWIGKARKRISPRLTRSQTTPKKPKPDKLEFEYNKIEKEPKLSSAIVSRQVFEKRETSSGSNTCSTKLCNTNLSIRTNLYDSAQDVKKTLCKVQFKPNQLVQLPQKNLERIDSACTDKKIKKVTWADSCNTNLTSVEKSVPTVSNGFQYSGSGVVDGFSPTSPRKSELLRCNNLPTPEGPISRASFSTMCESSIDSLSPDKLVNAIVKEKYHPMAKLLIGNMIGLENQESSVVNAYNTLTSESNKEEKTLKNKFYMKRKNGMMKKQLREIANLTIDAKFDVAHRGTLRNRRLRASKLRLSKSDLSRKKFISSRRNIQSRNLKKEIRKSSPKKDERTKMVNVYTQCNLLAVPMKNRSVQTTNENQNTTVKIEYIDLEDVKSEPCDVDSPGEEAGIELNTNCANRKRVHPPAASAFAAVSVDDLDRIELLRSINFRPVGIYSPTSEDEENTSTSRPEVDEEYNKYTSEENDIVGYMNEQLHFEDIEREDTNRILQLPKPIEKLTRKDFDKPWHGWKKIIVNGQVLWTGY